MVQQWLTLVLDLTTMGLALLVVGLAVHLRATVSVGLTGVSLVQLISFTETLKMLIQFWTSLETSIGAVARIKGFSEDTGEENLPGERDTPPAWWPSRGEVKIEDVSARYGEEGEVLALDGITLNVRAGEKVGICGRTGRCVNLSLLCYAFAVLPLTSLRFSLGRYKPPNPPLSGKSSLLLTLLRLLDPSKGKISIDDIDLSTLPRQEIRKRLITITQDQFVLPGTVRQNIDPFASHDDPVIEAALESVGIWDAISAKGGLDAVLEEEMLSHGQRQLFFLARAILRRESGSVVLLDEATSR
jgi:ATP-binding cassette, subfamily C (CFTR/MRP), member 1